MGIQNRDYYRDERSPGSRENQYSGAPSDRAVRMLIMACAFVFLLQTFTAKAPGSIASLVGDWLTLTQASLQSGQLWRILTYGFCHGDPMHLFFNMISLWVLGRMVESVRGSWETLWFFLAAVGISGLAQMGMSWNAARSIHLLGASGGVFGLVVLAAMHFPRTPMQLMFIPINIELRFMAILFLVLGVFFGAENTAHTTHFAGAAFGVVYYLSGIQLSGSGTDSGQTGWLAGIKRQWNKPKGVQLYEPPAENLDAEVDRILDKMNTMGK
ncbi:MAG: rhomboid family intramembrane serine protease, partial [Planctomycetaceae bacterium]